MIQLVDQCLEAFFRQHEAFRSGDVDMAFEAPDRQWGAAVTRPTVNVFLWDLRRNAGRAESGFEDVEIDGERYRRLGPTSIELQYLATAWASTLQDEHQLLGTALRHVTSHFHLPAELVPDALRDILASEIRIEISDNAKVTSKDLWQSLDGQLKPALQLRLMFQLISSPLVAVGPPTSDIDVGVGDRERPSRASRRARSLEEIGTDADATTGTTRANAG